MATRDCTASIEFLRKFRPAGPWLLTALHPDKKNHAPSVSARDDHDVAQFLEKYAADHNIYFSVNPAKHNTDRRAKKDDIAALEWLHIDVDPRAGEDLGGEQERILKLLRDPPAEVPPPTAIIFSGGGYQGFWKLKTSLPVDDPEDTALYNKSLETVFSADACHNVDRIMRLPGTTNFPNKRKREKGRTTAEAKLVEFDESRIYDISCFQKADRKSVPATFAPPANARRLTADEVQALAREDGDKLVVRIINGGDPDKPVADRSRILYWVVCEMVRRGHDDNTIYSIITDPDLKISASVLDKPNPLRYALRQIERAREESMDFECDSHDNIIKTSFLNMRIALARLNCRVQHNEFSGQDLVNGVPLDDVSLVEIREMIQRQFRFTPSPDHTFDSVRLVARDNAFHPVRDYIDSLKWDKTRRIPGWLSTYAGAEKSEYVDAVGRILLVAAIRRVRQPGCAFDTIVVLEGAQGTGKSTLIRKLAVRPEWFSDSVPLNGNSKEFIENSAGKWIIEASELASIRRADVQSLKGQITRKTDAARLAYGRMRTERPRQCIIVGSTNDSTYLADTTGNRRFLPVRCGDICLDDLTPELIDQLWAEAACLEEAETPVALPQELWGEAASQNEERELDEPWFEELSPLLDSLTGNVAVGEICMALGIPIERQSRITSSRIRAVMIKLGWEWRMRRFDDRRLRVWEKGNRDERKVARKFTCIGEKFT